MPVPSNGQETQAKQDFLDASSWRGHFYSDGWTMTSGDVMDVVEPATGAVLTSVGLASPADVRAAAASARRAQPEWAAS
jgi:benzaldehyde dehydrogenase (NAD)